MKLIPTQFSSEVISGIQWDMDGNEDVKDFLEGMASALITNHSKYEQLIGDAQERAKTLRQLESKLGQIGQPVKVIDIIMRAIGVHSFATSICDYSDANDSFSESSSG